MTRSLEDSTAAEMSAVALDLDPDSGHWLHDPSGTWSETNCYSDLWVQLVHRLGLDPVPMLAFTLGARIEAEQWAFAKPPPGDLCRLYGLRVSELLVWRPLPEHIEAAARHSGLLTVEVDAFWLPDTAGTSYRSVHDKTTIVPAALSPDRSTMTYLHNGGCFTVGGGDLAALFATDDETRLAPYTELVALDAVRPGPVDREVALVLAAEHLAGRPEGNPVTDLGGIVVAALPWLAETGVEAFHQYAFSTVRQCGATATLAAAFSRWLDGGAATEDVGVGFDRVADGAKRVQFMLARAARGRQVDLDEPFADMASAWSAAIDGLERHLFR